MKTREASDFKLLPDGRFTIHNYNQKRPFSNFLPGIAGLYGTPMWVFYTNRGQGIASFGTSNKDNAILEFFPANKAYQTTTLLGFRTFLKVTRGGKAIFHEPFRENGAEQTLEISSHEFSVREINHELGLEISAHYFTVPGESLAVLARRLEIKNISRQPVSIELLDGLPQILPYGMNEFFTKNMSRTIEAWTVVDNLGRNAPFFHLKVDATDRPEVVFIEAGNFSFSFMEEGTKPKLLDMIVDPRKIFDSVTDFTEPKLFKAAAFFKYPADQLAQNQMPCSFSFAHFKLAPDKSKTMHSLYGHAGSLEALNRYISRAARKGYVEEKRAENRNLVESLKMSCFTISSSTAYDLYCGQTYLDNILRGGTPIYLGDEKNPLVYYVYSRKHGDLERDYNRFVVEPTYFAQGNGNYRDVNQNRRQDVWFDPRVKDANIKTFLNLIQLDGFNPLVIKGARFRAKKSGSLQSVLRRWAGSKHVKACDEFLSELFSPGELYRFLEGKGLVSPKQFNRFFAEILPFLEKEEDAEHGEGFWTDHWTYNLDLIEAYLTIYPEDWKELLFSRKEYLFYDNSHRVRPRHEKCFLKPDGAVRQYQAVFEDAGKRRLLEARATHGTFVRDRFGKGSLYKTTLFVKLLALLANKIASLDPNGVGVEMEADKPSWYDALNGLPGLFGSSLPETFELKRLAVFLVHVLDNLEEGMDGSAALPAELYDFLRKLHKLLEKHLQNKGRTGCLAFWQEAEDAKENFRRVTAMGVWGRERKISMKELRLFLEHAREKIDMGLEKGFDAKQARIPTYFEHQVTRFRVFKKVRASPHLKNGVKTYVEPLEFQERPLPLFLEGPVHAMKVQTDPAGRMQILKAVRQSELYDKKLGMYKVCESLKKASVEIGRCQIFTPGWLEHESVWLHMEYKWLLEILRGGLIEEFYNDFKKAAIPFQNPERYGRSILENSSFIVSSVFPDPSFHGAGFVARLSGSTAEFLQMWLLMNVGKRPFYVGPDGKLALRFEPQLAEWLFVKEETERPYISKLGEEVKIKIPKDSLAFMFLGKTLVVYHNSKRLHTFGTQRVTPKKIRLRLKNGSAVELKGDVVPSPYSGQIRDGFVPRIDIELG